MPKLIELYTERYLCKKCGKKLLYHVNDAIQCSYGVELACNLEGTKVSVIDLIQNKTYDEISNLINKYNDLNINIKININEKALLTRKIFETILDDYNSEKIYISSGFKCRYCEEKELLKDETYAGNYIKYKTFNISHLRWDSFNEKDREEYVFEYLNKYFSHKQNH